MRMAFLIALLAAILATRIDDKAAAPSMRRMVDDAPMPGELSDAVA